MDRDNNNDIEIPSNLFSGNIFQSTRSLKGTESSAQQRVPHDADRWCGIFFDLLRNDRILFRLEDLTGRLLWKTSREEEIMLYKYVDVPKRWFVVLVAAAAVLPRMPLDKPVSIGGTLSRPFRKLILFAAGLNLLRHSVEKLMQEDSAAWFLVCATEGVALAFLSLLTPYLLRVYMSTRINFPGGNRPGAALQKWVYAYCAVNLVGLFMLIFSNEWHWIIRKASDMITFTPVRNTLVLYNQLTTRQARYPGRGTIMFQLVMIVEYNALLAQLADTYIDVIGQSHEAIIWWGVFQNRHFAFWTRALLHSILINKLDEDSHYYTIPNPDPDPENTKTRDTNDTTNNSRGQENNETHPTFRPRPSPPNSSDMGDLD